MYPGDLLGQLEDFSAAAYASAEIVDAVMRLLENYGPTLPTEPPIEWMKRLGRDYHLQDTNAFIGVRHIIWNQLVDVDPSYCIDFSRIVRPGGRTLIAATSAMGWTPLGG